MTKINELPDDLLLKILSLVPTKTVFEAQTVCKKWQNLWRKVSSLNFDRASHKSDGKFLEFMSRTMKSLESPVLESMHIRIVPGETSYRIVLMNDFLIERRLRNLVVIGNDRSDLAKVIYKFHTLVILRLQSLVLQDYFGMTITLLSLTVLELTRVKYPSDETLSKLLSSLPSLQDLTLDRCLSNKPAKNLAIVVPCLKRLTFVKCPEYFVYNLMMLDVNTPCLNYLKIEDFRRTVSFVDGTMEKLIEAELDVISINTEKLLKAIISAKRLSLCLFSSKIPQDNAIFDQLVRLEICTCQKVWWILLRRILLDSPKLRFIKLHQKHPFRILDPESRWIAPSSVPQCFASHLETFEWRRYQGSQEEKKLASYVFRNARILKTATINLYPRDNSNMRTELIAMPKASASCVLVFQHINDPL